MKKTILAVAMLLATVTVSAQFYISGGTGYSFGAGEKVLGKDISASGITDLKGSYGEGVHTQIRGGYFLNEKFGIELGIGYLHGADQDVQKMSGIPTQPTVGIKARGRAWGASLSGVYNVTNNFYVRAGLLTKLGGKTEAIGSVQTKLPAQLFNPQAPATMLVDLDANFVTNFNGNPPLGFTGAVGYKFPIADNWSLFAEVDYMGINVTRDTSSLQEFSATVGGQSITREQLMAGVAKLPAANQATFAPLLPLLQDEAKWGEGSLPSSKAPYSSIGINFGVTYNFK